MSAEASAGVAIAAVLVAVGAVLGRRAPTWALVTALVLVPVRVEATPLAYPVVLFLIGMLIARVREIRGVLREEPAFAVATLGLPIWAAASLLWARQPMFVLEVAAKWFLVAGAAWLVGMLLAFRLNSLQASTGDGEEFEFIIAAVVGGTLLTGGYGTAFGGAIGACIMAMSAVGIGAARWNSDWRFVFLGVILLLAVIANRSIRDRATALRR